MTEIDHASISFPATSSPLSLSWPVAERNSHPGQQHAGAATFRSYGEKRRGHHWELVSKCLPVIDPGSFNPLSTSASHEDIPAPIKRPIHLIRWDGGIRGLRDVGVAG
jgi:hypothetical protein